MRKIRNFDAFIMAAIQITFFVCAANAQTTPPPTITNLSPAAAIAGGTSFTLTVTGTNFTPSSQVSYGKMLLATTYVTATSLTAAVPACAIENPTTVYIGVINGSKNSNLVPFDVTSPPTPAITSLIPASAVAEGAGFTLSITGTNFTASSQVTFGKAFLSTTFISATSLTANVTADEIANPASVNIGVVNGSKNSSNVVLFNVTEAPAPTIATLSPAGAVAGGAAFTLSVTGANFTKASQVCFGKTLLATMFGSSTSITAVVPAGAIANPISALISVTNGPKDSSAVVWFVVAAPPTPTITSISPSVVVAGGSSFTLTVTGTNFTKASQVSYGKTALATTYVSATSVTAAVPASAIASAAIASVGVTNGPNETSNSVLLVVTAPPAPTVKSVSPTTAFVGGPAFTLTVTGTNFTPSSKVLFGKTLLVTTYVSATSLKASVTAGEIAKLMSVSVGVANGSQNNSNVVLFAVSARPST